MGVTEGVVKRRHRSKQERRAIVEETLKPGASVSRVGASHDVNANQVFGWRKLYREGGLNSGDLQSSGSGKDHRAVERFGVRPTQAIRNGNHRYRFGTCTRTHRRRGRSDCVRAAWKV